MASNTEFRRGVKATFFAVLLMFGAVSVFGGLYTFMTGFKNVDSAFNILLISYNEGHSYYDDYVDCNLEVCYSFSHWYMLGLTGLRTGLVLAVLGSLVFASGLYGLLDLVG